MCTIQFLFLLFVITENGGRIVAVWPIDSEKTRFVEALYDLVPANDATFLSLDFFENTQAPFEFVLLCTSLLDCDQSSIPCFIEVIVALTLTLSG